MQLIRKFIIAVSVLLVMLSANSHAGKMYKWVDKNGVVSYQDQPPPKNAKVLSEDEIKAAPPSGVSASPGRLPKIKIYTVEDCDVCNDLVAVLNKAEIPHAELPLLGDPDLQAKILLELGTVSAPTVFFNDRAFQTNSIATFRKELEKEGFDVSLDTTSSKN